ncbi:MAG: ATP-dependent DNA helicase RecG [Reichenbachiella sp.]
MNEFFETKIEFLKGVGPIKAKLLGDELGIKTFQDLISFFPFRYEDRSRFTLINQLNSDAEESVQIKGTIVSVAVTGPPSKQRLKAILKDQTGQIELVWFKGVKWMLPRLKKNINYVVYGKLSMFNGQYSISHPEIEVLTPSHDKNHKNLIPVYSSTETLKKRYLDSRALSKLTFELIFNTRFQVPETLDAYILVQEKLVDLKSALIHVHFPNDQDSLFKAKERLKFEELFFIQISLFQKKEDQKEKFEGLVFSNTSWVKEFYKSHLPFDLTGAQKKVIKEVYQDLQSGYQMNRLLQGDVGSGKTITSFICALIAISSGYQTTIMAPTEILAQQHNESLSNYCKLLGLKIEIITGSTSRKKRSLILQDLLEGKVHILVGTHALIEDDVKFRKMGLAIIDEQHRFGVAQRAKLWQKNTSAYPHVLVMTATPIPRTLAMTLYGDLDVSTIDELPKGRVPIKTSHLKDESRLKLFGFLEKEIESGQQVYIVYPLIEESEKMDYKDLMDGYESISRAFPQYPISILHGKMKSKDKDFEMARFAKNETKIMVATTVIEVGVDVPNATVMVIENSERFGLSQLHQLRGRVGRGKIQSYCILMTGEKLSKEARERIKCMVATTDGFQIAEKDLEIRGPGDLLGTQQSGILELKIADLSTDGDLLVKARKLASIVIQNDPHLNNSEHTLIAKKMANINQPVISWSSIS